MPEYLYVPLTTSFCPFLKQFMYLKRAWAMLPFGVGCHGPVVRPSYSCESRWQPAVGVPLSRGPGAAGSCNLAFLS